MGHTPSFTNDHILGLLEATILQAITHPVLPCSICKRCNVCVGQGMLSIFLAPDPTPEEQEKQLMKEEKCEGWCRNTDMAFTVVNHADPARKMWKCESPRQDNGEGGRVLKP